MTFNITGFVKRWRLLSFRKLLFLSHILSRKEKLTYLILAFSGVLFGLAGIVGIYIHLTVSVPENGGTYSEGLLREPRTINPLYATLDSERDISRLIYSGLLTYDGEGQRVPDLAERYDVSDDGKTYTVYLRNASWHDGEKVTAEDILFTIKTIQNPIYKSVVRANWQGVTVEAINDKTVRFTLRSPYAPFVENLTVGILPKHLWLNASPEQMLLHELNLKPVGSGPYRFDKFSQAKDGTLLWYQLSRNPSYYRGGPYINKIVFYFFKNEDDLLRALRKESIDGYGPASVSTVAGINSKKMTVFSIATPRVFGLFFNPRKNDLLADKKIRQAISSALNKKNIAQRAVAGGADLADGPLPFLQSNESASFSYNLDGAKKILDDAGWKDLDGDGIREKVATVKKKTATTTLRFIMATSDWPDLSQTADIIKGDLRQAGIDVIVEVRPLPDLESNAIRIRNFDVLLFGELYGFESDPFAFWHSSQIKDPGLNVAQYANPKADKLLEEARHIANPELRDEKYREFSNLVLNDLPAIFLYTQLYNYILPFDMKGVQLKKITLPADRFNMVNEWYLKTQRVFK